MLFDPADPEIDSIQNMPSVHLNFELHNVRGLCKARISFIVQIIFQKRLIS